MFPRRCSRVERMRGSNGRPEERKTSLTTGGTAGDSPSRPLQRCSKPFSLEQSSQTPPIVWLPQSHLRCRKPRLAAAVCCANHTMGGVCDDCSREKGLLH